MARCDTCALLENFGQVLQLRRYMLLKERCFALKTDMEPRWNLDEDI